MIQLNADEARVLGVLIEKALTTPEQYPLTLNAVVAGANQKSNRDPVVTLTEDQCFDALEGLRNKGLIVRVDQVGARVPKFRHQAGDVLHARTGELAILAELLVRGPQTLGELRGRAERMHPMPTLEDTRGLLRALMERSEPLVRQIPPAPGSRAERYTQLLAPDERGVVVSAGAPAPAAQSSPQGESLTERVARLETELSQLRDLVHRLASGLGESTEGNSSTPPGPADRS